MNLLKFLMWEARNYAKGRDARPGGGHSDGAGAGAADGDHVPVRRALPVITTWSTEKAFKDFLEAAGITESNPEAARALLNLFRQFNEELALLEHHLIRYIKTLTKLYDEAGGRPQVWGDAARRIQEIVRKKYGKYVEVTPGRSHFEVLIEDDDYVDEDWVAEAVADAVLGKKEDEK